MIKEEKDLLLKDLSARLPYGVKLQNVDDESIVKLRSIDLDDYCFKIMFYTYEGKALTICKESKLFRFGRILRYKPYLFPFSSLTEEQKKDLLLTTVGKEGLKLFNVTKDGIISKDKTEQALEKFSFNWINFSNKNIEAYINWCNKNHFDWRGLIPMGLAIDATNLNIY